MQQHTHACTNLPFHLPSCHNPRLLAHISSLIPHITHLLAHWIPHRTCRVWDANGRDVARSVAPARLEARVSVVEGTATRGDHGKSTALVLCTLLFASGSDKYCSWVAYSIYSLLAQPMRTALSPGFASSHTHTHAHAHTLSFLFAGRL